jgi:hypothetical protein
MGRFPGNVHCTLNQSKRIFKKGNDLMSTDRPLDEVKEALKQVLAQEPAFSNLAGMETLVEMFFKEVVSKYTQEELQIKLRTPETTVRQFQKYLSGRR